MKARLLTVVIALQVLWVCATVVRQERGLDTGRIILLETRPVDPRDLIRGDFVILGYEISDVGWNQFDPPVKSAEELAPGRRVWAELKPDGQFHRLVRVLQERREPAPGNVLLAGTLIHRDVPTARGPSRARISYGLERFYVREGTGNPTGKLTAEVAVTDSGRGILRQVFVDGVPYAEAMRAVARK